MNKSRLRYEIGSFVVPGDRLGTISHQRTPGPGTCARRGHLYASTAGRLEQQQQEDIIRVSVSPQHDFASTRVIAVGQIVLAKVNRVSWTQAHVSIYATETGGTLARPTEALLRREDIASKDATTIKTTTTTTWQVVEAVRPGDWIVARVLSLGDTQRYMISTAEPQLGVWYAQSSSSSSQSQRTTVLQPHSWNSMICPETGVVETRKCAKPK